MKRLAMLSIVVAVAAFGLGLLCSAYVAASELINDFDVAIFDQKVTILNPQGSTNGCALIYVFDNNQNLQDCCGCFVSGNGLLALSVEDDLLNVPHPPSRGLIEILSSLPSATGKCDPTKTVAATSNGIAGLQAAEYQLVFPECLLLTGVREEGAGVCITAATPADHRISRQSGKTFFANVSVQSADESKLANLCAAAATSCTCGTGG